MDVASLLEIQITEMNERLLAIEKIDLDERLGYIEKQLKFFSMSCSSINKTFEKGITVKIHEEAFNVINPLKDLIEMVRTECKALRVLRKELQSESVMQTLKFMAKTLHELTQEVSSIKENGIKKKIQIDLSCDGYEMVKKKPPNLNYIDDEVETNTSFEDAPIIELLKTLTRRESEVLINTYGLFNQSKKTMAAYGRSISLSSERIRQIQCKAIRKCRHASRKSLVQNITHLELKHDILGENQ